MTRGRKGNQTYTGHNGASDTGLRKARLDGRPEASVAHRVVAPSAEAMRAAIADGRCPFCGDDQFRNIALHTRKTHGFGADEVKEMAGIPKSQPMCSPEYSRTCREVHERLDEEGLAEREARLARGRRAGVMSGGPRQYSEAGRKVQVAKLEAARASGSPQKVGAANSKRRRAATAERDAEIVRRVGEGQFIKEVMADMGLSRPLVKRALVRAGVDCDMRTVVGPRRWASLESNPFTGERM